MSSIKSLKGKLINRFEHIRNRLYFHVFGRLIKVASMEETIDEIIRNNKSISRFGDGEFALIFGNNIGFQEANNELSQRLKEVLQSDLPNHMIALGDGFKISRLKYRSDRNASWNKTNNKNADFRWLKYINLKKLYYNATFTRFWTTLKDKERAKTIAGSIRKIWDKKDIIIIEGAKTRMGIGNNLLNNANSIKRIICPPENAFQKYSRILDQFRRFDKTNIILIALGPTATALAYDLSILGFQAIDIGHVDLEFEWMEMGVDRPVSIMNKYTNEVSGGNNVTSCEDIAYQNQILIEIL